MGKNTLPYCLMFDTVSSKEYGGRDLAKRHRPEAGVYCTCFIQSVFKRQRKGLQSHGLQPLEDPGNLPIDDGDDAAIHPHPNNALYVFF